MSIFTMHTRTWKRLAGPILMAAVWSPMACAQTAPAPAPANWTTSGLPDERTRLTWMTPGLNNHLNYGYVVCNADRTHGVRLRYSLNDSAETSIGPRQCFAMDSPYRLEIATAAPAEVKVAGSYQAYRWGSFGKGIGRGVTFALAEDDAIRPPVASARVHGLSPAREQIVACTKAPETSGAARNYYSICAIRFPRLANYRLCLPPDALGEQKNAPAGSIAVITSENLIGQGVPPLFRTIILPGACIDLHEESAAWLLTAKTTGENFDPAGVASVKVVIRTIAK